MNQGLNNALKMFHMFNSDRSYWARFESSTDNIIVKVGRIHTNGFKEREHVVYNFNSDGSYSSYSYS